MSEQIRDVILIEGLGGAGKTTTAQLLAAQYGYSNFNTGTLFRATAAALLAEKVALPDFEAYTKEAHFEVDLAKPDQPELTVNGLEVSSLLQLPTITSLSSGLGTNDAVAARLEAAFNQSICGARVVVEGKNLSDRIDCPPKRSFFLAATRQVRARRKWLQAQQTGQLDYTFAEAKRDTFINDMRDQRLLSTEGKQCIDTSLLTPQQVVQTIIGAIVRA